MRVGTAFRYGALLALLACGRKESSSQVAVVKSRLSTNNPFQGAQFFLDPAFLRRVRETVARPQERALVLKTAAFPSAIWISRIGDVAQLGPILDQVAAQQAQTGTPVISVFVLYDLPNRDCSSNSSSGELSVEQGGEARYKGEFVDAIANQFRKHPTQRVVALLEPDSIGNLTTNLGVPKCAVAAPVYRRCIAYGISKLSLSNVSVYLDAGHAGWLGRDGSRSAITATYQGLLAAAGGNEKIRGFFTNVSNYTPLRGADGIRLDPGNPCPNELTYVTKLAETLAWAGITGKGFVIDTGRNGVDGIRSKWSNWCNIRGAGIGERPRASPAPGVDAYFWVKTPGESDGSSDVSDSRFDENCRSPDAEVGAPPAGEWFSSYFVALAENANPPL